ncbi:MAG: hypothetical protein K5768_08750 [Firmicutes bacterium]|nr:hypothetical protein [Bacillota bacterium]
MNDTFRLLADGIDITGIVGGLTWQNTIDELATKMNFDTAKSDTQYVNTYEPKIGSIINLFTNIEIFRGIVIAVDNGDEKRNKYTVTDFGWYLNKSKETYQFNNMPAYKAINKVCADFNIPIDSIPELGTEIQQIYADKTVSDIISDILSLCGGGYNLDVTPKGLRIYKYGEIYAYPEFRITPNTPLTYSPALRGGVSHSASIEDMKNSIKVITEADKVFTVRTVLQDADSITKFGMLQEVVKIDPEKENAQVVAQSKLAELNRQKESFSFDMIEAMDSYTRAGMAMDVDGTPYLIEGTSHSITNGIHHVKVDLRRLE